MLNQKRIRDYGIAVGSLPTGPRNAITDVAGVRVGHVTLDEGAVKTGVTAVLPHPGNLFREKVLATSHVINGFGKTIGTIQIEELGTIETPILLTNTLSVGTVADSVVRYMLDQNPEIGISTGTVNPVVGECNDMFLNDIRGQHVSREHVLAAIESAAEEFAEGAVGAGTGMSCYHLKGGIGSASRQMQLSEHTYTLGVLVLSNFGRQQDLLLDGFPAGHLIHQWEQERAHAEQQEQQEQDRGSVILLMATDLPLTERQLKRICKRATVGLARTGSFIGNGSGDIVIGFTTAHRIPHESATPFLALQMLHDNEIDLAFRAVTEATEEAIYNSMICADTTTGRAGHTRTSLQAYIDRILERRA